MKKPQNPKTPKPREIYLKVDWKWTVILKFIFEYNLSVVRNLSKQATALRENGDSETSTTFSSKERWVGDYEPRSDG